MSSFLNPQVENFFNSNLSYHKNYATNLYRSDISTRNSFKNSYENQNHMINDSPKHGILKRDSFGKILNYENEVSPFNLNNQKTYETNQLKQYSIEIIGFRPDLYLNIIEDFRRFGEIEKYFYKTGHNWMIIKFFNKNSAYSAISYYSSRLRSPSGICLSVSCYNGEDIESKFDDIRIEELNSKSIDRLQTQIYYPSRSYFEKLLYLVTSW